MYSYDYFMQTNQKLMDEARFKEAIELCEYAISSGVWVSDMTRQCEALCRWTLAENYYYRIGDAKSARNGYSSFLTYVDEDRSMLKVPTAPLLQEAMEDMYVKACFDMGQLAISYDEYFDYIKKGKSIRPMTQTQKNQLDAVTYNREHNISWSDNIVQLAELELKSVESGALASLPCAVASYSLFLLYPEVDASVEILRLALQNYSSLVCRLVGESILRCASKNHPANPDNYRFILEQAIALVEEYSDDMETHDAAEEAKVKLINTRSETVDKSKFHINGFDSAAPAGVWDFIPPLVIKEQIKKKLSKPSSGGGGRLGCLPMMLVPFVIGIFVVFLLLN